MPEPTDGNGKSAFREIAETEKFWQADAVFLALGFVGVEKAKFLDDLGVELTARKTITVNKNKRMFPISSRRATANAGNRSSFGRLLTADARRKALPIT